MTDGNVGEFLKFLPGMAINSVGGEARTFMLNGVPPNNVPITIGGFSLAGAAGSSTSRRVELDQVSLNNISRIEVLHSPTPESPGSALAGSINMVPRSAFERSRPAFNGSVYVLMRDNARHFHKTPGPLKDKTRNDPYNLASYTLASSNGNMRNTTDVQRSAYASLRREFDVRGVPVTLKGGLDVRNSIRDLRGSTPTFSFRGADGRATTTPADPLGSDDNAVLVGDEIASQRTPGFGFPRIQWVSNEKYWDLYKAHPEYFVLNQNDEYRSSVSNSKRAEEIISSAYVRGDVAFFERRLRLVGGLRAEQTNLEAEGPLTDATRNFQRDASGKVIVGANGRPLPIVPSSDAVGVSRLTYIDRGTRAEKEYLRLFPSINASFNLRENLIARAAFYTSVGRPDFNQYAGGLTLPDTENAPSTNNRISVHNVAIKAWSAKTVKVQLEYYSERVGQLSVGAFQRDFENFFGRTTFDATPEFLELYGLDPAICDPYLVSTQHNITSTMQMTGLEFDYKQALTFLPRWTRGVQVFANASALRATGGATANFNGFVPRVYNWGVSLTRERYNLRMNWNYRGRQRDGAVTGRSIEPGTYEYTSKILNIEVQGEYHLRKKIALFAAIRNLGAASDDAKRYGPSTPLHARFRDRNDIGAMWMLGLRGSF